MSPETRAGAHHPLPFRRRARRFAALPMAVLVAALLAQACASGVRSASSPPDPGIISPAEVEEMRRAGVRDLYDLVFRQRPNWLRVRIDRSLNLETTIKVYHNETPIGGIDALRGFPLLSVVSIRYLDAAQAAQLTGRGSSHIDGAIIIQTVARPGDTVAVRRPPPR